MSVPISTVQEFTLEIDHLLEQYLQLLDQYSALRSRLSTLSSSVSCKSLLAKLYRSIHSPYPLMIEPLIPLTPHLLLLAQPHILYSSPGDDQEI